MSVYSDSDYEQACEAIASPASSRNDANFSLAKAKQVLAQIQDIAEGGEIPIDEDEEENGGEEE